MRYRRWSRITTDRNFSDFDFLNTLFLGFWVIQTGYWPVADESLQIGGLLHQGQFRYCSGYEASRVQTIFKINLEIFILLRMHLL